jgi:hypothetical protein
MRQNLDTLSVGDFVTIIARGDPTSIKKVIRITKAQIITAGPNSIITESRWNKSSGREVGSSDRWSFIHIEPTTDDHRNYISDKILLYKVINLCDASNLRKLNMDTLEKLVTLLED